VLLVWGCSPHPTTEPQRAEQAKSPIPVSLVVPKRGVVSRELSLTATVEAYEQAPLYAKVSGYVTSLSADIGDRVTKGQVLATLDVP